MPITHSQWYRMDNRIWFKANYMWHNEYRWIQFHSCMILIYNYCVNSFRILQNPFIRHLRGVCQHIIPCVPNEIVMWTSKCIINIYEIHTQNIKKINYDYKFGPIFHLLIGCVVYGVGASWKCAEANDRKRAFPLIYFINVMFFHYNSFFSLLLLSSLSGPLAAVRLAHFMRSGCKHLVSG